MQRESLTTAMPDSISRGQLHYVSVWQWVATHKLVSIVISMTLLSVSLAFVLYFLSFTSRQPALPQARAGYGYFGRVSFLGEATIIHPRASMAQRTDAGSAAKPGTRTGDAIRSGRAVGVSSDSAAQRDKALAQASRVAAPVSVVAEAAIGEQSLVGPQVDHPIPAVARVIPAADGASGHTHVAVPLQHQLGRLKEGAKTSGLLK